MNEYRNGRTPNPDVMCNQEIKFNAFLDYAPAGCRLYRHGALCRSDGEGWTVHYLVKGADKNKDQSYFLARITEKSIVKDNFSACKH